MLHNGFLLGQRFWRETWLERLINPERRETVLTVSHWRVSRNMKDRLCCRIVQKQRVVCLSQTLSPQRQVFNATVGSWNHALACSK